MAIEAVCGSCGRRYQAPDNMAGKRVKCKQCGAIFMLPPAEFQGEPDLETLADLERSHSPIAENPRGTRHGSHASAAAKVGAADPTQADEEDADDEDSEDGEEKPVGRRNVRFRYKYSQMLDAWLAPAMVLLGLAWTSLAIARAEDVPPWLVATRVGIMLLFYAAIVLPLTLTSLRMAGRAMRYQLPRSPAWRTFAAYMPAFTLGLVMWNVGGGAGVALFLGLLLGLGVSAAALWALFRLQPAEIAPSAGYGAGGFLVGTVITGLIMFGLNLLTVRTLIESKKVTPLPASPFGQAFAWVPKIEESPVTVVKRPPVVPGIDLKTGGPVVEGAVVPATRESAIDHPSIDKPTPATNGIAIVNPPTDNTGEPFPNAKVDGGDPPPVPPLTIHDPTVPLTVVRRPPTVPHPVATPTSALIAKIEAAPLEGNFDALLRPSVKSAFAAVVRAPDGTNTPIELWDTDTFTRKAAATFSNPAGSQDINFVLSPDGVHLARVAVFPKPSVQVWSFPESRVDRSIDIFDPPNTFELIGFVSDSRLLARVDAQTTTIRWIDIANPKKAKLIDVGTLLPHGGASLATNPAGTLLVVATKFNNDPTLAIYTLESGAIARRIRITALDANMNLAPTGMAFSPDGTQVAAIFEQDGGALIVTYVVNTGKPVGDPHVYPSTPIPARGGAAFGGSSLAWLPDGKAWLLYGDAVIDAASGRVIDRLAVPNIVAQRFVGTDGVELTTQDSSQRQLLRVKLDTAKLSSVEPTKFESPKVDPPK